MKKKVFTMLPLIAFVSLAAAQENRCGTTAYYQMRMAQDPGLKDRMEQEEEFIQQWIKDHPQPYATEIEHSRLPKIPGFQSSGNLVADLESYKSAKEAYISSHPMEKSSEDLSEEELQAARAEHHVTFISVTKKSK